MSPSWPCDALRVLERGWLSSNNLLFLDDEGATVVDTGYVTDGAETVRLIDEALAGRTLRRIVNTHLHSDHAGGNALLQARHGCEIWIPPGEQEAVATWDEDRLSYRATSQQCPRFRHDHVFQPYDTLRLGGEDWTVLPAAGHDHAMVMLWCERLGVLASADALWEQGFGVIFPELTGASGFAEQGVTLDLIADLDPRWVVPGHGAPFHEVGAALTAARSRLQWLQDDPRRHTDHALKVLLAFKLLEARQMSQGELTALVQTLLDTLPGLRQQADDDAQALTARLIAQLTRTGAVTWCDGMLVPRVGA
ncbi:MAG: MBL fold metallo-hydrolase [Aquabacterium sp.]|uniref:MBL fold metallo-hydrolase n=1 Tax=Aquabacterium sp. TaxID=1872578 RepID=UPI001B51A9BC|nr:MBL fold metallo-hydrolase [Aquabacterium sp.]MBP7132896.1 MBL fold metallo-hydrolase [Aquabacterium sp.]MBP9062202.1 MBL fold metallo-hydrolase [Aquabacterium sp.]